MAAGGAGAPARRACRVLRAGVHAERARGALPRALPEGGSLPSPAVNAWIDFGDGGSCRVDFLWRARRLVLETDGYACHSSRGALERDRRRGQRLELVGYEVIRFAWREIADEPGYVQRAVRALLARLARP